MDSNYELIMNNPEACREEGKRLFFNAECSVEEKMQGFSLLKHADQSGDLEARYILGRLFVERRLEIKYADSVEHGLTLICYAADCGYAPARTFLNQYCDDNYQRNVKNDLVTDIYHSKPLVDFNGKEIKINKSGIMTPIDAKLEYINGENVLTLSANVVFYDTGCNMTDTDKFFKAVLDGFREWSGEYEVFAGQKLRVVVEITSEPRVFDNVLVIPVSKELNQQVIDLWSKLGTEEIKSRINNVFKEERSAAGVGIRKWSVTSRKIIYIQGKNGCFDDFEEFKHIAKHEFGHALGLGDLYKSSVDGLNGVDKGSYKEIDSYYISDNIYNLVMCDHHGPISNNDIEMVVLAFSENCFQKYQHDKIKGKISKALGKGN